MKRKQFLALLLSACLLLGGCGVQASNVGTANDTQVLTSEQELTVSPAISISKGFSERDYESGYDEEQSALITLDGSSASCSSDAVSISGSTVTITDEGSYVLSGTLDGMIIINADKTDKLQIVLNGVQIHSESSAAIYVLQADKVFLTLPAQTQNTLSNGGSFVAIDENNIDAVLFSKEDLTLNGTGSLTISSPAGHAIVSKDDLIITGGIYDITAASHGISGKDCVNIAGGDFSITSGKDGIHAENTDDTALGTILLAGGSYEIFSDGDGISASNLLQIEDGSYNIVCGGGSANAPAHAEQWGFPNQTAQSTQDDTTSMKGLKGAAGLLINGGSFTIDAADDALHSNAALSINGGSFILASGDDGLHADAATSIHGGTLRITESYEGIEGLSIIITGGEITLKASDDGLNAAGGNDASGFGGYRGNDQFASGSDSSITISGGTLYINASGDGIDSNGALYISGGEIYVSGPSDGANGALDYTGSAEITGGVFIATGSTQMAMNFTGATQGAALVNVGSQSAGSTVILTDAAGQSLLSFTPEKQFDSILISCPSLVQGESYTLSVGGYEMQLSMDSLLVGSSGMGGMMPGGMGGGMGGNPGGMGGRP